MTHTSASELYIRGGEREGERKRERERERNKVR